MILYVYTIYILLHPKFLLMKSLFLGWWLAWWLSHSFSRTMITFARKGRWEGDAGMKQLLSEVDCETGELDGAGH